MDIMKWGTFMCAPQSPDEYSKVFDGILGWKVTYFEGRTRRTGTPGTGMTRGVCIVTYGNGGCSFTGTGIGACTCFVRFGIWRIESLF